MLRGGNTKAIRQWDHNELSVYGIAKEFSTGELKEIAGLLVAEGLLAKNSGDYATFRVSETGRSFLKNRESLTLAMPKRDEEKASSASRTALDYDQALFDVLRNLRRRLAAERQVPPYNIFNDVTLQQMAYYFPQTRDSLSRISGVGAKKLEDLGETFLSEIIAYAQSRNLEERDLPVQRRRPDSPGRVEGSTNYVERIRQTRPRAYEPWTAEEDQRLKEMQQENLSIAEISRDLGRQPGAIRSRLRRLGLGPQDIDGENTPSHPREDTRSR